MDEETTEPLDIRGLVAYALMFLFVCLTSIGFAMIDPAWGVIAAGVTSGLASLVLGDN